MPENHLAQGVGNYIKRHKPEEIVAKLRQVDVLVSQGQSVAEAIRSISVTEVAAGRAAGRRDLLQLAGGADHHRELAVALQHGAAARIAGLSTARAGGVCARLRRWPALSAHRSLGGTAHPALTSTPDHRMGAGHSASSSRNLRVARCGGGLGQLHRRDRFIPNRSAAVG